MLHVTCPSKGVYLVNELPVPVGRTLAGGVAVYERPWRFECERCRPNFRTTRGDCVHIEAVEKYVQKKYFDSADTAADFDYKYEKEN